MREAKKNNNEPRRRGGNQGAGGANANKQHSSGNNSNNSNNNSGNGGGNQPSRRRHQHEAPSIKFQFTPQPCILCGETIQEMSSAIAYGSAGEPAHFECVQKKIEAVENLNPQEKVVYWGAGQFAIVKTTEESAYTIVKKISVEAKDVNPEWRREIKTQIRSNE